MCIWRSAYFDNFQNKKNIFLIQFCSAIWSDPYTRPLAEPCFLKLTHVHALPEVVKIVNWRDPCFIHLRSPEQFGKKMPCLSEGYELSVAIDKNVKKTNGSGFRRWMRSEYCFDIGVECLMSRGLQLKNYIKKQ